MRDSIYWPTILPKIQEWFTNPANSDMKPILCQLCKESHLKITGYYPRQHPTTGTTTVTKTNEITNEEIATVLSCGHIFGQKCLTSRETHCREKSLSDITAKITCPICEWDLSPPLCPIHQYHGVTHSRYRRMSLARQDERRAGAYDFGLLVDRVHNFLEKAEERRAIIRACLHCRLAGCRRDPYPDLNLPR